MSRQSYHRWSFVILALVFGLVIPSNVAARLLSVEMLPFVSLQLSEGIRASPGWESEEPGLVVVATNDVASSMDDLVDNVGFALLQEVDYVDAFGIGVFLGRQPEDGAGIEVTEIHRRNDAILIVADAWFSAIGHPTETSPYHLVKVEKAGEWNTDIEFVLAIDGAVVLTQTHFIPEIHPLYLPVIHTTDAE